MLKASAHAQDERSSLIAAVRLRADDPDSHNLLGIQLLDRGRPADAVGCFEKAIEIDPGFAEAHFNLGLALRNQGNPSAAIGCLQDALRLKADFFQALFVLGNILLDFGDMAQASACYRRVIAMAPDFAEAHYNLGNAARAQGDGRQAAACYRRALVIRPDFPEALNNLGLTFKEEDKLEEAVHCYRQALAVRPAMAEAHYNMGIARQLAGQFQTAQAHYQEALNHDPNYAPAKWLHLLALPIIYEHADAIPIHRQRFARNLDVLIQETSLAGSEDRKRALSGVSSTTHFFLQYQGQDDLKLQRTYGAFLERVMAASYPHWSQPRPMPPLRGAERIRIGYVSSFMRNHTVGQFLLGWLEGHHRERFEIFCYHIGSTTDALTEQLQAHANVFHQIGGHLEKAAARIAADNLHVLVYTDIGMNALASQLAALRLAPVQCKGWGHPVTTGLPTIDYYLGSDLMEPEDAQRYYSETLIRLPNLALNYTPAPLPPTPKTRRELGIGEDAFVYLNSQSLFKNLPQHDDIYPRIAGQVPNARFVFIAHAQPGVTRQFADRLSKAFTARNLRFEDFCAFQPKLSFPDFLSLNLAANVLLDTLEWSGGKTTLEAIGCGLPVVTCPGRFMRGRHAYAMLRMMGATRTIASDKADYIRIATALAQDPSFYGAMRAQVSGRKTLLYRDGRFIAALEEFYTAAARRGIAGADVEIQRGLS
jgi:protein O-GlcNAc transferase